jgi:hypothetical protein
MTYSAIVSYHTNPYTCGVARFNHSLARTTGVPLITLESYLGSSGSSEVLLSIKLEEIDAPTLVLLAQKLKGGIPPYLLFLHATDGSDLEVALCTAAVRVFAASAEIAKKIRAVRGDVVAVFAPGAPVSPRQTPVDCTLLTFGMAHKIRSDGYRHLAKLMVGDRRTFRLEISTALHEGGTFDESFFGVGEEISVAFAGNVRFLGFLADAEVSDRLFEVDALVAFFPRGARENNTTVLSAMTHGCAVITNLDAESPPWMVHNETVFDVNRLTSFPDKAILRQVGEAAAITAAGFNFDQLALILRDSGKLHGQP